MVTWKIVEASKASVFYIYIDNNIYLIQSLKSVYMCEVFS